MLRCSPEGQSRKRQRILLDSKNNDNEALMITGNLHKLGAQNHKKNTKNRSLGGETGRKRMPLLGTRSKRTSKQEKQLNDWVEKDKKKAYDEKKGTKLCEKPIFQCLGKERGARRGLPANWAQLGTQGRERSSMRTIHKVTDTKKGTGFRPEKVETCSRVRDERGHLKKHSHIESI